MTRAALKPRKLTSTSPATIATVRAAIEGSGGNETEAARRIGWSRSRLDFWLRAHPDRAPLLARLAEMRTARRHAGPWTCVGRTKCGLPHATLKAAQSCRWRARKAGEKREIVCVADYAPA